eukprot:15415596-Alexandrium_andersonii.AAC.1
MSSHPVAWMFGVASTIGLCGKCTQTISKDITLYRQCVLGRMGLGEEPQSKAKPKLTLANA